METLYSALYWWLAKLDFGPLALVGIPLLITVVFLLFVTERRPTLRALRSAHGVLLVAAMAYAIVATGPEPVPAWRQLPFLALFALSLVSLLYSLWREKRWYLPFLHVFTLSYAVIIAYRAGLGAAGYVESDCWLPEIVVGVPVETPIRIGDENDRMSASCPVPLPRVMSATRPYGALKFEIWGSPHRLYMTGSATDGSPLQFSGDDVVVHARDTDSWLKQYSHRRTFRGEDSLDTRENTTFDLAVRDASGAELEQLSLTYRTERCRCRSSTF